MEEQWINLYETTLILAKETESKYRNTIPGKDALLSFLDANDWFETEHFFSEQDVFIKTIQNIKPALVIWLSAYGKTRKQKLVIMMNAYKEKLPETCERFSDFITNKKLWNSDQAWKVLDFLLSVIEHDLIECDEKEIRSLLERANQVLTVTEMKILTVFFQWNYMGKKIHDYDVHIYSRQLKKADNNAYCFEQYCKMAYMVFNPQYWKKQDLIRKAAKHRNDADLWLFTAMHFVCALRKSDIEKLPVPVLPYSGEELRKRILMNRFTEEEARNLTLELSYRIKHSNQKPNKTRNSRRAGIIKVFFPESLLIPLGIIMALSLSYRKDGDSFVHSNAELPQLRKFFGEEFAELLNNKKFYTRKANKAYLQGIDAVTDDEPGRPKGYMLAAIARSHSGDLGTLPDVTDVYLKDAEFSGYRPEFILMEMFERGIFGFIPCMLLEKMEGESYKELDEHSKTQLIQKIGLSPEQYENITETVMLAKITAAEVVERLFFNCSKLELNRVLQRIAAGAAPSRQKEYLCLLSAAGLKCSNPERTGCLGCGYEIYTKSAAQLLMSDYIEISMRKKHTENLLEKKRCTAILKKGILPAIAQILESIPMLYKDVEMSPIYQIVERGIRDANHC